MRNLKSFFATLATCSSMSIQQVLAQGLVGAPPECLRGHSLPPEQLLITPVASSTEYLPLATVLVTLAMGIFILRARREEPPNWLGATKDLLLLFGIPALVYGLWVFVVNL